MEFFRAWLIELAAGSIPAKYEKNYVASNIDLETIFTCFMTSWFKKRRNGKGKWFLTVPQAKNHAVFIDFVHRFKFCPERRKIGGIKWSSDLIFRIIL